MFTFYLLFVHNCFSAQKIIDSCLDNYIRMSMLTELTERIRGKGINVETFTSS